MMMLILQYVLLVLLIFLLVLGIVILFEVRGNIKDIVNDTRVKKQGYTKVYLYSDDIMYIMGKLELLRNCDVNADYAYRNLIADLGNEELERLRNIKSMSDNIMEN